MSQDTWPRLIYLIGFLVLVLPALAMYRHQGSRIWRDIAIWLTIAAVAALAYRTLGPGA